jgi:four helix bundle protein
MATISSFEEMEIWQLARKQANELNEIYIQGTFARDFELRNQINASSGSVMDNIAEGFERSGNKESFNFLIIAKGSNDEVRSQLHRAFDRNHITKEIFGEKIEKNKTLSSKIATFLKYLKTSNRKGFRYE